MPAPRKRTVGAREVGSPRNHPTSHKIAVIIFIVDVNSGAMAFHIIHEMEESWGSESWSEPMRRA